MAATEGSFVAVKSMEHSGPHPESSDEEDSFVVLEKSSPSLNGNTSSSYSSTTYGEVLPPLRTNKVHEMQNLIKMKLSQTSEEVLPELPSAVDTIEAVASSVAKITISPDSSYEEIQKQVEDLIKENETLKNTIAQNNMSMKTQYERFVMYKDDVNKVMKSYKDKINEAKGYLDKYKEENLKLASELEVYVNLKKLHEEEIIGLKDRIRKLESTGFVPVKSDETELNESAKTLDFQSKLAESNLKVAELTNANAELQTKNNTLTEKIKDMQNTFNQVDEKIKELTTEKEDMVAMITKLRENLDVKQIDVDKLTEKLFNTPKFEIQLQAREQQMNLLQFQYSTLKDEMTKLKNENDRLRQELSNVSEISKSVEVSALTHVEHLQNKEATIKELSEKLRDSERLVKEGATVAAKLKDTQEDYIQIRSQLSIAQQTITALETVQEDKVKEVDKLRKLIQESQDNNDELFALKEQLTVYKNDFEAEKESKKTIEQEKAQLVEDLQNLQKRNKQLQNEVETLRARNQPREEGYSCPKCSFAFASYQSLENHVHRCLDLDGFP